jgi:hypothetical protein
MERFGGAESRAGGLVMELLRLDRLSEAQALAILKPTRWELLDLMAL